MIDLTKPIKVVSEQSTIKLSTVPIVRFTVELAEPTESNPRSYLRKENNESESYRRLFEAAPRMLAWMKEVYETVGNCHDCIYCAEGDLDARYLELIAEIECTK